MSLNDKSALKNEILRLTKEYARRHHVPSMSLACERIHYSGRVYDDAELVNLVDSALEFWLTAGRYTKEFEKKLAAYLGVKYCSFVNSGSSANLLAFMALTSPLLKERAICPGDEVITVAAGFPTTISPIMQYGAIPVFIDITIPQYNLDNTALDEALSNRTKAVFVAHTLGNPFDITAVKAFCKTHNLWLIEDNCDALGAEYTLGGTTQKTGSFGDIGTSSFYPPHHITTGEGGAIYTSDSLLAKIISSMRDWGRDCICASGQDNRCGHRFDGQFGNLPIGYDHKYVYSHFGYNLKATDMQAAIGVAQLDKLDFFVQRRQHNFNLLNSILLSVNDRLILPEAYKNAKPSWFGYLITCTEDVDRNDLINCLEKKGIQTRMLFAGNIVRQPCFDRMRNDGGGYRIVRTLDNSDRVMKHSFWIGVYPGLDDKTIEYMANTIIDSISY